MSRTVRNTPTGDYGRRKRADGRSQRLRQISVRSIRRDPPDARKLGKAIIQLALTKADAERAAQNNTSTEAPDVATGTSAHGDPSGDSR